MYNVLVHAAGESNDDDWGFTGIPFDKEYSIVDGAMVKRCTCLLPLGCVLATDLAQSKQRREGQKDLKPCGKGNHQRCASVWQVQ